MFYILSLKDIFLHFIAFSAECKVIQDADKYIKVITHYIFDGNSKKWQDGTHILLFFHSWLPHTMPQSLSWHHDINSLYHHNQIKELLACIVNHQYFHRKYVWKSNLSTYRLFICLWININTFSFFPRILLTLYYDGGCCYNLFSIMKWWSNAMI